MLSTPSLSGPSIQLLSRPLYRPSSLSSFPTAATFLVQHHRSASCSQQPRALPLLTALAWAGSRQCCPQAAQSSQAPVSTSMSAAHTSGCHTEPSESKNGWSRHLLRQDLRKEGLGSKVPTHHGLRARMSSQASLMTACFSPRVSRSKQHRNLIPTVSASHSQAAFSPLRDSFHWNRLQGQSMTQFLEQRGGWVGTGAGRHELGSGWGLEV